MRKIKIIVSIAALLSAIILAFFTGKNKYQADKNATQKQWIKMP
jgi:hypothetical protein